MVCLVGLPIFIVVFYCKNFDQFADEEFEEKWGAIYEGLEVFDPKEDSEEEEEEEEISQSEGEEKLPPKKLVEETSPKDDWDLEGGESLSE